VGWTRAQLADAAHINRNTVRKVESADGVPRDIHIGTLIAIQETLFRHGVSWTPGGAMRGQVMT
jgi:transcriptional regulator with XRE-family HTH domain